ncbi:hypothetical protein CEXT_57391 [Caerostris extrusa]|uniref:Uncharacterized protein n=1 Tax=Caerostris extrusa TaxID=172846 RepID=A0AAV4XIL8_CAEEX|nr:hypothetical protein CEXT_57391 [Caerostris extrusa]
MQFLHTSRDSLSRGDLLGRHVDEDFRSLKRETISLPSQFPAVGENYGNVLVGHPPILFYYMGEVFLRCVAKQRLIGLYIEGGGNEMVLNEGSNRSGEITFLFTFPVVIKE